TVSHVLANVINQEIPFEKLRADTPAPLLKLLKRCLDRDLHTRLQWIGEARVVLEEYLAHPNSAAIPPIRRTSFMGWLGWICALAIAAATMVFFLTNRQPETTLSTLRYTIALPDDTLLTDQLALSPDGRMLAVITASPAGNRQIFLRPLDSLQGHVLPTTEGAGFPFWSPDSRYIAFFADDKLKRIDVNGGPSETLEQAPSPRGGSWSFAGDIIFSAGSVTESSLQHIASTGGPPHNVPGLTGEVRFPWFLPDGRHFLYTIVQGGTYWASLDGKENRRILSDVSSARFVSGAPNSQKGFILFVRQNSIIAQSFDSASGTLTGDPVSIADGAEVAAGGYASIAVSDRHVLVYQTEHPRTGRLAWFDRSGVATTATEEPGDLGEPEIGPDGKTISFALQRSSFFDIWLWDTLRGTGTRFTLDDGSHHGNVWSPTGDQIVFTASRSGHPYDLSIKPSSGNGPEKSLLETQYSKTVDQWSAIGRLILYAELNPKTKRDVWAVPMETNTRPGKPYPVLQTEFNEVFPQLSPDGKWLAYTSDESGQREVYVQTFPPGDGKWKVSVAGGEQARWRGDGKELYFVNAERKMMMAAVTAMPGPKPIFQAATPVVLFDPHIRVNFAGVTFQYDVTPDGKRFLVASSTDDANTSVLSVVTNFTAALKRDTH
ncbi:MAG TPA: hypothetical protein VKY31_12095, partial [Terriglobia bacterium]|nr:hypothetical protein [Terriglobia bacterium]